MNGDMAAFEEICAAKRRELYFTALAMLGSNEDAEDAVQNAMISMFKNIGKLKKPEAVNSWMHKILHDNCVNIIRKNERQVPSAPLSDDLLETFADKDISGDPGKILGDKEIYEELYRGISLLPVKSREVIVLYYFSDMKYRDIAKLTDTSIKTVLTNLMKAKKHLKSYLKERYPEMLSLSSLLSAIGVHTVGGGIATASLGMKGGSGVSKAVASVVAGTVGVAVVAVTAYAILSTPDYTIALSGDCECGHINPQSIEIEGMREGDSPGEWELLAQNGSTLYAGDLDSVTSYISLLEETQRDGHYTLHCIITNKNGNRYDLSRNITIGNLAGDEQ
jgi:RNA polymerase sigma-70 factor (ECF subfamily)